MGELAETPPSEEERTEHVCLQAEWLETTGLGMRGWPQGPAGKKRFPSRSGSQSAPGEQSQRQKAAPLRGYTATAPES